MGYYQRYKIEMISISNSNIKAEIRTHLGSKGYYLWFHACSIQLVSCHYPRELGIR